MGCFHIFRNMYLQLKAWALNNVIVGKLNGDRYLLLSNSVRYTICK